MNIAYPYLLGTASAGLDRSNMDLMHVVSRYRPKSLNESIQMEYQRCSAVSPMAIALVQPGRKLRTSVSRGIEGHKNDSLLVVAGTLLHLGYLNNNDDSPLVSSGALEPPSLGPGDGAIASA